MPILFGWHLPGFGAFRPDSATARPSASNIMLVMLNAGPATPRQAVSDVYQPSAAEGGFSS